MQPRAAAALLGRFLWSCSKKASQTPKGNPLATVSHDPATTLPGTVSYRAERTCVSAQPSSADACNVGIRCSDDVWRNPAGCRPLCGGRFLWSWVPMQRRAFAWGRRSSETTETSGLPGGEGCAACDDAKRPRPRKENRFATVSHDHAATQPSTVSHRAERISNCESQARLRRPCQKQQLNL